jgi:hypothetical protein
MSPIPTLDNWLDQKHQPRPNACALHGDVLRVGRDCDVCNRLRALVGMRRIRGQITPAEETLWRAEYRKAARAARDHRRAVKSAAAGLAKLA